MEKGLNSDLWIILTKLMQNPGVGSNTAWNHLSSHQEAIFGHYAWKLDQKWN